MVAARKFFHFLSEIVSMRILTYEYFVGVEAEILGLNSCFWGLC